MTKESGGFIIGRMRVVCPHCQAAYQLEQMDEDAILVCHRCGVEFNYRHSAGEMGAQVEIHPESIEGENSRHDPIWLPDEQAASGARMTATESVVVEEEKRNSTAGTAKKSRKISQTAKKTGPVPETRTNQETKQMVRDSGPDPVFSESDEDTGMRGQGIAAPSATGFQPGPEMPSPHPPAASAHIMPWLLGVVFLLVAAGAWYKHDAWLNNLWLRSVLINMGMPLDIRNRDWRIPTDSIQAQWIRRNDGSEALLVKGRVKNLLRCELPPPAIHVSIFARDEPDHLLFEREMLISQPPLVEAIRRTPYLPPPEDHVPVPPLGDRSFVLLLQKLPENAGDYALAPVARGLD